MPQTKTVPLKKCAPVKCKTFFRMFTKFLVNRPTDVFVSNCPNRTKDCFCTNEKESLTETYIPIQPYVAPAKPLMSVRELALRHMAKARMEMEKK